MGRPNERPFGKHYSKWYKLMRFGLLLGGLLTNSESWIYITEKDISSLEKKTDTSLIRRVLTQNGHPSKVFMLLELGNIPVRFALM